MSEDNGLVVGSQALRALTHPLRIRLLDALEGRGRATASQLALDLDETTGATSYHLRQLARHGFIEELPEMGKTRERWWRPVGGGWTLPVPSLLADRATRTATTFVLGTVLEAAYQRAARVLMSAAEWAPPWQAAMRRVERHLTLDSEQLRALNDELTTVVDRYRNLPPRPSAKRVEVQVVGFPTILADTPDDFDTTIPPDDEPAAS